MRLIAVTIFAFCTLSVVAQEETVSKHPYAIILGFDVGDEGSVGAQAALSYGLLSQTWLSATVGTSRSPNDLAGLDIFSGSIGVDHRFKSGFGLTADVDYWGDQDALSRIGIRAQAYYRQGNWRLGVLAETRDYDVTVILPLLMDTREAGFDSDGYGLFYRYSSKTWGFFARGTNYDYSINPRFLNTAFAIERLGLSAITLADSLLDRRVSIAVDRKFSGNRMIEIGYAQSQSAVDDLDSDTVTLAIVTPVGDRTDLEISFGTAKTEGSDNSLFGGVLLTIYGF